MGGKNKGNTDRVEALFVKIYRAGRGSKDRSDGCRRGLERVREKALVGRTRY
jgi:hypothetical protein